MKIVKFLKEKMTYIVFTLILLSSYAGIHHRDAFLSLKWTLPIALFMMLFQPMVFMDIRKAFAMRTKIKTKYLVGPFALRAPHFVARDSSELHMAVLRSLPKGF